jgi:glycerophosphoryl diester phosphodiesterase
MKEVAWISHRGLDGPHAENSFPAFAEARAAGFRHVETDLRTTLDGHVVLHHDRLLSRTAGEDVAVDQLTLEQFLARPLGNGQQGLVFTDFARHFSDMKWILDIKPETADRTLRWLHDWSREHHCKDWLTQHARFLVWRPADHRLLHHLFTGATTMADQSECRRAGLACLSALPALGNIRPGRTYSLPPRFQGISLYRKPIIQRYHARGARVLAFLPEAPQDLDAALDAGVDEVLTNHPPGQAVA